MRSLCSLFVSVWEPRSCRMISFLNECHVLVSISVFVFWDLGLLQFVEDSPVLDLVPFARIRKKCPRDLEGYLKSVKMYVVVSFICEFFSRHVFCSLSLVLLTWMLLCCEWHSRGSSKWDVDGSCFCCKTKASGIHNQAKGKFSFHLYKPVHNCNSWWANYMWSRSTGRKTWQPTQCDDLPWFSIWRQWWGWHRLRGLNLPYDAGTWHYNFLRKWSANKHTVISVSSSVSSTSTKFSYSLQIPIWRSACMMHPHPRWRCTCKFRTHMLCS